MRKIRKMFSALPDPRAPNALHDLLDVIVIALATVLCGGRGATDMEVFASSKKSCCGSSFDCHTEFPVTTRSAEFNALDPEAFERAFRSFMAAFAEADGIKRHRCGGSRWQSSSRGLRTRPQRHATAYGQCLRDRSPHGPGRMQGAGPQRGPRRLGGAANAFARRLHRHRRRPALQLSLRQEGARAWRPLRAWPSREIRANCSRRSVLLYPLRQAQRGSTGSASTHDRYESRRATVMRNTSLGATNRFPGVAAVARITSRRRLHGKPAGKPSVRILLAVQIPACTAIVADRPRPLEHRKSVALGAHVVFGENGCWMINNGPENFAILRRAAINLIRAHPARISMRQKVKRAGWEDAFLLSLICHMR